MPHLSAITPPQPPAGGLWTQAEAAKYLNVSVRYLRESACPKVLLPGNGKRGQPLIRYSPMHVIAWFSSWGTNGSGAR